MGVTNLLGDDLLDQAFKGPFETWISLHTDEPVPGGASNEVTGLNYVRELVNPSAWTTPASSSIQTNITLTFATAGDNWGTITHVGVYGSESGSDLLCWGALNVARTVNTGETLSFTSGNLSAQMS